MRFARWIPDWLIDVTYTGASALVFLILLAYASRSRMWRQAETIPFAGVAPRGVRAAVSSIGKVA